MENLHSNEEIITLADTVYGEARGEYERKDGGLASLIAVANVVINRVLAQSVYGKSIQEVCLKKMQFSCWNSLDPNRVILISEARFEDALWHMCYRVAKNVSSGDWPDLTAGSNHYYARWMSPPFWAQGLKPRAHIGQHAFFRL
jgi:N-acetylmuramoyl-L-alanine amidase